MTYAIIKVAGKQYRVREGERLLVDRLAQDEGATITPTVLLVGGFRNDAQPLQTDADTWVFHVGERRWEQRHPAGPEVGPSSDHVLVYLPSQERFLLLRGDFALAYDPALDRWEKLGEVRTVTESGAPSDYRILGSTMGALDTARNVIVLFGGERWTNGVQSFVDTTAIHDPATNTTTVTSMPPRSRTRTSTSPIPMPIATPTTSSTAARPRRPDVKPIATMATIGAKMGRGWPRTRTHSSHATPAATAVWRVGQRSGRMPSTPSRAQPVSRARYVRSATAHSPTGRRT